MYEGKKRAGKKPKLIFALFCISGLSVVAFVITGNRMAMRSLLSQRDNLASSGWMLSWTGATSRPALFSTRIELENVRLSGPAGHYHVLYGCNHVTIRMNRFRIGQLTLTAGTSQAVALVDGDEPDAPVLFAMRLNGRGENLSVRAAGTGRAGVVVNLTFPDETAEIDVSPVRSGILAAPFTVRLRGLRSVITWGSAGSGLSQISSDTVLQEVILPLSVAGLGQQLSDIRLAVSADQRSDGRQPRDRRSGQPVGNGIVSGETTVVVHMGEGRFGPLSAALAGRLVRSGGQNVGDFDLTLRGLDRTATRFARSGVVSPAIAQITHILTGAASHAAQGKPVHAPDDGQTTDDESLPDSDTTLTLPLRIRDDSWTLGSLPLNAVQSLFPGRSSSSLH
ncbi:DUF2125 domain-containing protein [Acetobacter musti]|uniref:DUF2125 domain-containing protein n=1 Tax=Acetobacter musti TaxID=864732 RepID=A0ABX0JPI7_9PROT|nr:hypothetical protein [Acetobacter musti]NHN85366.1 DUF2125 domain-containing protein [Acetobacter musti]